MKLFVDNGGTEFAAGDGWNYNNGSITKTAMENRVLDGRPGRRTPRIKYTQVDGSGNNQFYWKPGGSGSPFLQNINYSTGGIKQLDPNGAFPQIIYFI